MGGAMLVVVVVMVVVHMWTPPPVLLLLLLLLLVVLVVLLALGAALHGMHVDVRVDMRVGQQGGRGGQLRQGGVSGVHPDDGLAQQVNGMGQSGQDELKTLLRENKTTSSSWGTLEHWIDCSRSVFINILKTSWAGRVRLVFGAFSTENSSQR